MAQTVKNLPAMQETLVQSLGPVPWTEEPSRIQSTGSQSRTQLSDFHFHYDRCEVMFYCDFDLHFPDD